MQKKPYPQPPVHPAVEEYELRTLPLLYVMLGSLADPATLAGLRSLTECVASVAPKAGQTADIAANICRPTDEPALMAGVHATLLSRALSEMTLQQLSAAALNARPEDLAPAWVATAFFAGAVADEAVSAPLVALRLLLSARMLALGMDSAADAVKRSGKVALPETLFLIEDEFRAADDPDGAAFGMTRHGAEAFLNPQGGVELFADEEDARAFARMLAQMDLIRPRVTRLSGDTLSRRLAALCLEGHPSATLHLDGELDVHPLAAIAQAPDAGAATRKLAPLRSAMRQEWQALRRAKRLSGDVSALHSSARRHREAVLKWLPRSALFVCVLNAPSGEETERTTFLSRRAAAQFADPAALAEPACGTEAAILTGEFSPLLMQPRDEVRLLPVFTSWQEANEFCSPLRDLHQIRIVAVAWEEICAMAAGSVTHLSIDLLTLGYTLLRSQMPGALK